MIRFVSETGGSFAVEVDSPAGEGDGTFEIPAGSRQLPGSKGETVRPAGREVDTPEDRPAASPLEAGMELFRALFQGEVASLFSASRQLATEKGGGLRIKLVLNPRRAELAPIQQIPWELLCQPETGSVLALDRQTPVVRFLRAHRKRRPAIPRPDRLRILAVAAEPSGCDSLELARERRNLEEAWKGQKDVDIVFLDTGGREELRRAFLDSRFHVLHFMGHGGFDEATGEGRLLFKGPDGAAHPVTGRALARELEGFPDLRLVVLNACHTARAVGKAGPSPFAGVATSLVMGGVPAVVAMQRRVSDPAAVAFSRTFYQRLAAGEPVDAAVTEARLAIDRSDERSDEWATPVLFLRSPEGDLYAREPAPPGRTALVAGGIAASVLALVLGLGWRTDLRAADALQRSNEGFALMEKGEDGAAREAFRAALRLDPENAVAHANLSVLEERQGNYGKALAHARAAVEAEPKKAVYHFNLGGLLAQMGRDEEARESLLAAVLLDPAYAEAYNELGALYLRLDRPADARRALEAGLRAAPELPPLHKNLARVALAEGRPEEAVRSLEKARFLFASKDLSGLPETFYWLAEAHARAGRRDEACRSLSDLRLQEPAGPWRNKGERLAQQIGCDGVF